MSMKRFFSIKFKFIFINLFLVIAPVCIIAVLSLNQFKDFSNNTIAEAYQALNILGIENMKSGVQADYQKIKSFIDNAAADTLKLADSSAIKNFLDAPIITNENIKKEAHHQLSFLLKTCDIHKKLIQDNVNTSLAVAENILDSYGEPSLYSNMVMDWHMINQYTLDKKQVRLQALKFGNHIIQKQFSFNSQSPIVDKVGNLCNVTCTIFQRMNNNGDMLRISTNVKKLNGKRAVGTYIPAINPDGSRNPVVSTLINDEVFRGHAYVVNNWYLTAYKPIKDNLHNIIGALYVGILKENEHLVKTIMNIQMNHNGLAFIVNKNGRVRIHAHKEYALKHIVDDLKIDPFKDVLENKKESEINHVKYSHDNREMITFYQYYAEWEWFICVSFPYNERIEAKVSQTKAKVINEFVSVHKTAMLPVNTINYNKYKQIKYIDNEGNVKISLQAENSGIQSQSNNDRSWFKQAESFFKMLSNTREVYNTGVRIEKDSHTEEMILITPVIYNDQKKGYIVIHLDWTIAWKLLENHSYGKTGHSFIINQQGIVVAHPKYSFKDQVNFSDKKYGRLSDIVKNSMLKNKMARNEYDMDDILYKMYYMPVMINNQQYSIAAAIPADECLEMANKIKSNAQVNYNQTISLIIIAMISSALIAMMIAFLLNRSINKPLTKVVQFSKKVAEGDLSEQLSIKRSDEIGEMADALNHMVAEQRKLIKLSNLRKLDTPIFEIDREFNLTFVNEAFCHAIQKSPEECMGLKCHEFINTQLCQSPNCIGQKAINERRNIRTELRVSYGKTDNIPVLSTYIPIENKGIVEGTICFIIDQTDIYDIIDEVKLFTKNLNDSSEEFASLSKQMSDSASEVAGYSEQSSTAINYISQAGEEISSNINNESISIKEMSQSLRKISEFTRKAKDISSKATEKSTEITDKMESMALTSEAIGRVIVTIDEIADRTDLLALNAAIEAEGAGSAGKGFAVVADEVQKLAKQSSDATNEITRQIENVQKNTKDTRHDIQVINNTISEISTFNSDIALAVENLNTKVSEISDSVSHTSQKASSIADNANQSSQMASDIVTFSRESAVIAQKTNDASLKMSEMTAKLLEVVNKFKL